MHSTTIFGRPSTLSRTRQRGGLAAQARNKGLTLLLFLLSLTLLSIGKFEAATAAPDELKTENNPPIPERASSTNQASSKNASSILKERALAEAEHLSKAYPSDPMTHALLGSAYYNIGRPDEASKHLKRSLELRPNMPEILSMLAKIAYERGDPRETVRLCEQITKGGRVSGECLNRLGRAQMDLGDTDKAIQTLKQSNQLTGASPESSYLLGQAYLQSRKMALAKQHFLRTVELVRDHTQAFFGLFTASQRLGQSEDAERYRLQFQRLEAMDRDQLVLENHSDENLSGLEDVRKTTAKTLFGAAQIHQANGSFPQASKLFFAAASYDSDSIAFRTSLESLHVRSGDVTAGVDVFQRLQSEDPSNPLNHLFLGRLQTRLKKADQAAKHYKEVQRLAPGWAEGYRALAELYLITRRDTESTIALIRRAVSLEANGANYYLLAIALQRKGNIAEAKEAV
ncbi:MAG: tetratricopeptide repeat protein, partial [Verrucomicrobiota bacterium]|nr:tetratricopeptide repeat protein [Verrucomicrobiota bacterium]